MALVNHILRNVSLDSLLWRRHIRLRHAHQVNCQLFQNPQRPDLKQLIHHNILRGIPARNMEEGRFDVSSIPRHYRAAKQLEATMIRRTLTHTLNDRPHPNDLKERNILSSEGLNPLLVSRAEELKLGLTKAQLNRHLRQKKSKINCPTIKPQLLYFESFRTLQ
jgi:hypothetical protein